MENYKHLDLEKKMTELLRVARLQGQWTATKSFIHQAELLGEKDTKIFSQLKVHLESVEKKLPYNPNIVTPQTKV
jgi:hypothetical protein